MRSSLLTILLAPLLLATAGLGSFTATAAADASVGRDEPTSKGGGGLYLSGGEPSAMSAHYTGGRAASWRFQDAAGIRAGGFGCRTNDPTTVDCPADFGLDANLGRNGGSLAISAEPGSSASLHVSAGPGDDVVTAGPGIRMDYAASGGRDALVAPAGSVAFEVGAGWSGPRTEIDLAAGTLVHTSDRTTMTGVATLVVRSPARVLGTTGADVVEAFDGEVVAGDGDDRLAGWGRFRAGADDDRVVVGGSPRSTTVSRVSCGSGTDSVGLAKGTAVIAADCERLFGFAWEGSQEPWIDPRPHRVPGRPLRLRFRVGCASAILCDGRLRVSDGRRQSSVSFVVEDDTRGWVTVPVPRGRRVGPGTSLHMRLSGGSTSVAPVWTAPVVR